MIKSACKKLHNDVTPLQENAMSQYWNRMQGALQDVSLEKCAFLSEKFMDDDIKKILKLLFANVQESDFGGTWNIPSEARELAGPSH